MEQTSPKKEGIDEKLKQLPFPGEARRVTSSLPFCVPVLQNETIRDKEQPDSDRKAYANVIITPFTTDSNHICSIILRATPNYLLGTCYRTDRTQSTQRGFCFVSMCII